MVMTKKKAQLTECLEQRHLDDEVVEMMNNTEVCLNCGKPLKYLDKEKRRNRGYCCLDCYYNKPPQFAFVEQVTGQKVEDYILQNLNSCDNVTRVAELVGVTKQTLHRYIKKHNLQRNVEWRMPNGKTNKNYIKHR